MMSASVLKIKISFPEYTQLESRLNSYDRSSHDSFVNKYKLELSKAGFFYSGKNDETICYYCGGGLRDWQEEDQPWEEHAKWFSRCPFVVVNRSEDLINHHINESNKTVINKSFNSIKRFTNNETMVIQGLECVVCLSAERNVVFLPCKHCCSCTACALSVDNCVYCRTPISSIMKIFLV